MAILIKPSVDPAARWVELLAEHAPGESVRVWPDVGDPEDIEFAIVRRTPPGALNACSGLRWVASIPAGVEPLLEPGVIPPSVPIIRCVSKNRGQEMAEYVLLQTLRFHRRIPRYEAIMAAGAWEKLSQPPVHSRSVGVMGLGELGFQVASRLANAGFDTAGWTRTARAAAQRSNGTSSSGSGPSATTGIVENFSGPAQLQRFLERSEIVVCVLPLTFQTAGIINAETLAWMPQGASVINVSRGAHVVEADLIAAIDRGHIEGACLDVLSVEPPPADLPALNHPRIYVTPHIACRSRAEDLLPGLLDNMERARNGVALTSEVDRGRGY